MPLAPCQVVEICTSETPPSLGVTSYRVTRLESLSDSVRTRPGSGSATFIRYLRDRPRAVTVNRVIVPGPTPPDSTWKSENCGGRNFGWCSRMSLMYPNTVSAGASTVFSAVTTMGAMQEYLSRCARAG